MVQVSKNRKPSAGGGYSSNVRSLVSSMRSGYPLEGSPDAVSVFDRTLFIAFDDNSSIREDSDNAAPFGERERGLCLSVHGVKERIERVGVENFVERRREIQWIGVQNISDGQYNRSSQVI